jgi:hypothetical protein
MMVNPSPYSKIFASQRANREERANRSAGMADSRYTHRGGVVRGLGAIRSGAGRIRD